MISEYTKFKLHRRLRRAKREGRRRSDVVYAQARAQIVRRWQRLGKVRRFVISWGALWVFLLAALIWQWSRLGVAYQQLQPVNGGTFTEGIVGTITNINPLFAIDGPSAAASRLVFNGLLRYDDQGQLVGDLAERWTANAAGTLYIFELRQDVRWHDGRPLTAEDVVFTFTTIQHPDTRSPLNASWRDIKVQAVGDHAVEFTLANTFSPFPHALTTGIVPAHRLAKLGPSGQRPAEFNQAPIGTGPFRFNRLDASKGEATFAANDAYYRGRPRLDRFVIRAYDSLAELEQAYRGGIVTAAADLPFDSFAEAERQRGQTVRNLMTTYGTFVFYKLSQPVLADRTVRQALGQAVSARRITEALQAQHGNLRLPLLPHQLGYDPALQQAGFAPDQARQLLDQAGWQVGPDGVRAKAGQTLHMTLVTQDESDYVAVAAVLQQAWREIGVAIDVQLYPAEELQQSYAKTHNYDLLLYAIDLGADPDVFAYWHSSQATAPNLNLSEWRNAVADDALESGRTRTDPALRAAKYRTFLEAWRSDVPATALYNRHFLYVQYPDARTFNNTRLIQPADRLNNVEQWTVRLERR